MITLANLEQKNAIIDEHAELIQELSEYNPVSFLPGVTKRNRRESM